MQSMGDKATDPKSLTALKNRVFLLEAQVEDIAKGNYDEVVNHGVIEDIQLTCAELCTDVHNLEKKVAELSAALGKADRVKLASSRPEPEEPISKWFLYLFLVVVLAALAYVVSALWK